MKKVSTVTFYAILGELFVGGGGRLIAFGPISLRMILFTIAMTIMIIEFARGKRIPRHFAIFMILFIGSLGLALTIGVLSKAQPVFWLEDLKPLLYVLILPFFYFVLSDFKTAKPIPAMIVCSGILMASLFFITLFLIHSNVLPFLTFYDLVIGTTEFFFRAETTFFYKGFIYLCVALIFVSLILKRHEKLIFAFLAFAIIITFTRGFIFALALTWMFYALLERKYAHIAVSISIVVMMAFFSKPIIYQLSTALHWAKGLDEQIVPKDKLLGNRDESDAGRVDQVREVFENITPVSFLIGHGFGNGTPSRPVHMEISYLEIFHKQGIIGLAVWAFLFFLLFKAFRASPQDRNSKAYFYAASFIFFQSITNQFVNNPIGLSFVLLSLTWLHYAALESHPEHEGILRTRHQKGDEITAPNF